MKRFRFSILGLFSTVTIAALGVSLYQTHSRLKSSEAEVRRLRNEAGHLSIEDADKVHVIAVPGSTALTWRWRVYLPGGHDFGIYAHKGKLDANGYPATDSLAVRSRIGGQTNPREPREILIDAVFGKTAEGDPCLWIRENGRGYSAVRFGTSPPSWIGGDAMFSEKIAGQSAAVAADVAAPLGLIRLDGIDKQGETTEDAVLIWIDIYQRHNAALKALHDGGAIMPGKSARRKP